MTRRVVSAGLGGVAALALWRSGGAPWFECGAVFVVGQAGFVRRRRESDSPRDPVVAAFETAPGLPPWAPTRLDAALFPVPLRPNLTVPAPPPPVLDSVARRAALASAAAVANITVSSVSAPSSAPTRIPASLPTCPRCGTSIQWHGPTGRWWCMACGRGA